MSSSRPSTPVPTASAPPVNNPAYNLLSRAHSPSKATALFTDKLKNKPLLLQPSHTVSSGSADKRSLRRHIRLRKKQYHLQHQKPRPLSAKEKRQLGVYDLRPEEVKYDLYRGLNRLWRGYILEVLGLVDIKTGKLISSVDKTISQASHGSLIASADFHGMEIEVVRCVDVGRVGLKGIVVRETRSTFVVVTPRDKVITILKKGAIFKVVVPLIEPGDEDESTQTQANPSEKLGTDDVADTKTAGRQIALELHGSQLEIRPVERAVRKFKWKNMDYL